MPEADDTLADIDSMLEDYVTWDGSVDSGGGYGFNAGDTTPVSVQAPSHLPKVATPEEAEKAASSTPPIWEDIFEAVRMVRRRRISVEETNVQVMNLLFNQLRALIPELQAVEVFRDDTRFQTYADATNGSITVRYVCTDEQWRRATREDNEVVITFRPTHVRMAGDPSWAMLRPDRDYLHYYDQRREPAALFAQGGEVVEATSVQIQTVMLDRVRIAVPTPWSRRGLNGQRVHLVTVDEVHDISEHISQVTPRFAELGVSAEQAGESFAVFGLAVAGDPEQYADELIEAITTMTPDTEGEP